MANEQPDMHAISAALGTLLEQAPRLVNLEPLQAHQEVLAAIQGLRGDIQRLGDTTATDVQRLRDDTAVAIQGLRIDIQGLRVDMNARLSRLEFQYANMLRRNLNARLGAMSFDSLLWPLLDVTTGQPIELFPGTIGELVQLDEAAADQILGALQVPALPGMTVQSKREKIRSLWA